MIAEDEDAGGNGEVQYSLAEESASAGMFALDAHSGWLTTLTELDRETMPEHRLQV